MSLSFRSRIVLVFSALFLGVQAVTLASVYWFSRENVIAQLGQNLAYAETTFTRMLMDRGERTAGEARILVADFGFRSTASQADPETVASALENLVYRIRARRAFYVDLEGRILADTAGTKQGRPFPFPEVLKSAEDEGRTVVFGVLDGRLSELAVVPVLAPLPIGWVGIAMDVDRGFTDQFKRLSPPGLDLALGERSATGFRVLASSLGAEHRTEVADWVERGMLSPGAPPIAVTTHRGSIIAVLRDLPAARGDQALSAVFQVDMVAALVPYRTLMYTAFGLSVAGVAVTLFGSLLLAEKLARPVRQLAADTEHLLAGPSEEPPPPHGKDELVRLAEILERAGHMAADMAELQQRDRRRRELVADVSHDLRTPLSALHGYLETLKVKADTLPPEESRRFVDVAMRQSEKLGRLARELFELARLECEESLPQWEDFSIAELVQDILQKFQSQSRARGVDLRAEVAAGLPQVSADIGMIERVLANLLDNALRHTPAGGSVRIGLSRSDGRIVVTVADTGAGIPEEFLPTLFERDSPLSRRSHSPGGLGLILVGKMLSLHGCSITVDSTVGQGSIFRFELPIATPAG